MLAERRSHGAADVAGAPQAPAHAYDRIAIPEITPELTCVTLYGGVRPCRARRFKATPPAGLEPGSPFGPNLRAFVLHLRFGQAIPFERLARLMHDPFGLEIGEGALANLLEDSASAFAAPVWPTPPWSPTTPDTSATWTRCSRTPPAPRRAGNSNASSSASGRTRSCSSPTATCPPHQQRLRTGPAPLRGVPEEPAPGSTRGDELFPSRGGAPTSTPTSAPSSKPPDDGASASDALSLSPCKASRRLPLHDAGAPPGA